MGNMAKFKKNNPEVWRNDEKSPQNSLFRVTLKVTLCTPKIVYVSFLCISGIFGYRSMGILIFLA